MQGSVLQVGGLVQTISDTKKYIYLPAGGAITQANVFLPITPTPYVAHAKILYPKVNHFAIGHSLSA